jgi:hypothetical protein
VFIEFLWLPSAHSSKTAYCLKLPSNPCITLEPSDPGTIVIAFLGFLVFIALSSVHGPKAFYGLCLTANSYPPTLVSPSNSRTLCFSPSNPRTRFIAFLEFLVFIALSSAHGPKVFYSLSLTANSYPPTLVSPSDPRTLFLSPRTLNNVVRQKWEEARPGQDNLN